MAKCQLLHVKCIALPFTDGQYQQGSHGNRSDGDTAAAGLKVCTVIWGANSP
ncbi:unnamed protein product [Dovyalis caffra]|uniref:Uncharacterized protein n=1 Tax=Dovyalis caffra TaxID=77055 RepID=A0AAV1SMA8_9ROSI|nr:unnamed protein product [Dovyalis caffra]